MEKMINYNMSPEAMVMISGSSIGTQRKYYDKGYWYKQNSVGYEGRAEYLVSKVMKYSNIDEYVTYENCTINGVSGCRSKNFIKEKESYISLQRLYDIYHGGQLSERIRIFDSISDRINFVKEFVQEYTGLDIQDYLGKLITLDMLTLNTDRHFNNIGIIVNPMENTFRPAPVFDNGNSLLSNMALFPFDEPLEQCMENVVGQPFSVNLERQAMELGYGLKVDYNGLKNALVNEPYSRALEVLQMQLEKYEKIISNDKIIMNTNIQNNNFDAQENHDL